MSIRKVVFKRSFLVLPLLIGLALVGCKKDDVDLTDPIPKILDVQVSPTTVVQFEDSVIFEISYRDGNGDLGENDPDAENLYIVDNRIGVVERFRIQELAPEGSEIPIQGTLRVMLRSTGITDNSSSQTATFDVYVRDRAGNESNHFTSPEVTIVQ